MKKEKEEVYFDSMGPSGNIYAILAMARDVLRRQRRITEYNDMRDAVEESESYEDALTEIRKHVNLIDIKGRK